MNIARARFASAGVLVPIVVALAGCSPESVLRAGGGAVLPHGVLEGLPPRRMSVVWAPETTMCGVCNAPVADALARFAAEYPQAAVVTALAAEAPFPEDLVVGRKLLVAEADSDPRRRLRPYIAVLDAEHRLLGWRRIPDFGRQDDFVYQELLGAYALTEPLE